MIPEEIKPVAALYFKKQTLPIFVAIRNNAVQISSAKDFNESFAHTTNYGFAVSIATLRITQ